MNGLKIKVKREFRRMNQGKKAGYFLKHGKYLIMNATVFPDSPYDGNTVVDYARQLLDYLSMKKISQQQKLAYKEHLSICFEMMDENYDYIDLIAKGEPKIIAKAGLNSRNNNKVRTQRPKADTAAHWGMAKKANQLVLETTRDETSRITTVISSTEKDFKVELTQQNRIKISLGDKSCVLDYSTAAKIVMDYLEGGQPVEAYIVKANANGLAPLVKMQKNTPHAGLDYCPPLPLETKAEQGFMATEPED